MGIFRCHLNLNIVICFAIAIPRSYKYSGKPHLSYDPDIDVWHGIMRMYDRANFAYGLK